MAVLVADTQSVSLRVGFAVEVGHIGGYRINEAGFVGKFDRRVGHRRETNLKLALAVSEGFTSSHGRFFADWMVPPTPGAVHLASLHGVAHLCTVDGHLGIGGGNAVDRQLLAERVTLFVAIHLHGELGLLVFLNIQIRAIHLTLAMF